MSTLTQTSLANIALGHIGKAPVTNFNDRSPEAQVLRQHWDLVRDELLRTKAWKFATRRAQLTSQAGADPLGEWGYLWQLPTDYLRAVEFNGRQAGTGEACFDIEGTTLFSNDASARLKYVARIEQVSAWDANFCAAFALLLAAAVAPSISTAPGLGAGLRERGENAAAQAFGPDTSEARPRSVLATGNRHGYLAARYGGALDSCSSRVTHAAPAATAPVSANSIVIESFNEDGTATCSCFGQRFEITMLNLRSA